ncbi:MAG: alanine racemase [Aestuariibacter sp.]
MPRPAKVTIDLSALRQNLVVAKRCSPNSEIVAVLKANAYGHGAIEVANALQTSVSKFAVSSIEEALQLREAGITSSILLLEGCFSASELLICQQQQFDIVVHSQTQVDELRAAVLLTPLRVWIKVDTGMHRLGMNEDQAYATFKNLLGHKNVSATPVLMTHMASADLLDANYTPEQHQRFCGLQSRLGQEGLTAQTSIGNSGTIMGWDGIDSDWSRPGIMLYGLSPFAEPHPHADKLRPVMALESEVIALRTIEKGEKVGYGSTWTASRQSRIATVAIGYGDGYPRNAKSGTPVLINGQRGALAGRVSMDMLSVDVTDLMEVQIGDAVELWGNNLNANEVAQHADTIGYELVTRMPIRVPKHYIN